MSTRPELEARIVALTQMGLAELRKVWRSEWGSPPKIRSTKLLRLMIAWRLQAAAEGGLEPAVRRHMRTNHIPRRPLPAVGTRLTREYLGVPYTVVIGEGELQFAGRSYANLSEVARDITGTNWNGPRFFGLRPDPGS